MNFWIRSNFYGLENEPTIVMELFWKINDNILTFELNFHCIMHFLSTNDFTASLLGIKNLSLGPTKIFRDLKFFVHSAG